MKSFVSTTVLLLMGFGGGVFADELTLKNGDRVSGKVMNSDDKTITFKTEFLGEIKVDRAAITNIKIDAPVNVTLRSGEKVVGTVMTVDDALKVQSAGAATVTAKAADVAAFRDDAAQKAWEREQERVAHPRLNDFWSGFVSLGIANASGNASTTTLSTAANATRAAGKNKMAVDFVQIYAKQSTTTPFGATANRMTGSFRIDRDISKKLFVYGVNSYDFDRFLDLNLRMVLGGGLGYHAWKNEKGYLDLTGGGQWNRETFDITAISSSYTTQTRNSAELAVGEEAGYNPFPRLKLWERLAFLPNMSQTGEYRMNFDTTASVPVMKWLEWNVGFSSRYLTNPPLGKKNNDTILTMGVRASFDQTKR